ncbi:MAG: HAD family hydrolase [Candidatus Hydrogenedentales bacterium]|jgi:beta-phosphoglucomutase-like phosphatase (HAD superfamily)
MRLILFDIDGTLTATTEADNGCYDRAFLRAFGIPLPTTDWHAYTHVTDVGILREVVEPIWGRSVTQSEIDAFESAYLDEIERAFESNPEGFEEVPGARELLQTLQNTEGVAIALATGGMRRTALFKLSKIGIDGALLPGGFANDAISRADIARVAAKRSGVYANDTVYVGDGMWDLLTSRELGMRYIGITRESNADRLRDAGATALLEDYSDPAAFFVALQTATVPIV